ncbi:DUF3861 domain-containing protein [Yersinia frederiksenii]|uniref:DUF3861 domain-containing protein n=2 Tax=Yersinia frederiksenii TaxID=29484 RepID=UPI0025AB37DF|nr:DUF3861 domain-containing protein [Yersinia frederiksenii]MDN0119912.1 DUF3861 domain-containing protein [Yersinia frederiksenii]
MPGYRYRITIEPLTDRQGEPVDKAPVTFEAENHDDILNIIERLQAREDLDFGKEKTAAFALGLKLFSETMMENRKHPIFAPLRTAFMDFMTNLKQGSPRDRSKSDE